MAYPLAAFADTPKKVAVFGDSLSQGLWLGLSSDMKDDKNLTFARLGKVSTGLVKDRFYDWTTHAETIAAGPYACGICQIGLNDQQAIDDKGQYISFDDSNWPSVYEQRASLIGDAFVARKVPLVWVGLPNIRGEALAQGVLKINGILSAVAAKTNSLYVSTWEATSGADNRFTAFVKFDGRMENVRANDGEHMTGDGYKMVARLVISAMKSAPQTKALFA